jgi:hypothetical protein
MKDNERRLRMPKSTKWWVQFKDKSVAGPIVFEEETTDKEFKAYVKQSYGFKKMPAGVKVSTEDPSA